MVFTIYKIVMIDPIQNIIASLSERHKKPKDTKLNSNKIQDMNDNKNKRRGFLKAALAAVATIGLASVAKKSFKKTESKKTKMLTPDGRLVEVDESVISKAEATKLRASNKELKEWMKTSKT